MADLILFNANILSMCSKTENGNLVAIGSGKILAVTEDERLKEFRTPNTRLIDCGGKPLLPGFIDAHCHMRSLAEKLVILNLSPRNNVISISDIQSKIQLLSQALPSGTWIRGKGYDEFYLGEKRHPTRYDLDRAAPNHPVKLTHRSGHAHVLNSLALQRVGISRRTPDPPGALIDRDVETGDVTGLLFEMGDYLSKRVPPLKECEIERGLKMANSELLSLGITSVQDASFSNDLGSWKKFCSWKEEGLLKPRVSMMLGVASLHDQKLADFSSSVGETQLRLGGVKVILDETTGHLYPPQTDLNEMVLQVHRLGARVAIHAIEENAIESACDAISYALEKFPKSDHRHHIVHCSVCPPALAKRLASLKIIVVTQPPFVYYNGDRYLKTVPVEKLRYLYPLGTFIKSGLTVAGSSDFPVSLENPLVGVYAAVSRRTETGNVIAPEEKISSLEALQLYTLYAAKAICEDTIKGSITPEKLADLVILNENPTELLPEKLKEVKVEKTIINGEVVWSNDQ